MPTLDLLPHRVVQPNRILQQIADCGHAANRVPLHAMSGGPIVQTATDARPAMERVCERLALAAILLGLVARYLTGLGDQLWLDETLTGVFTARGDPGHDIATIFAHEGGPLFQLLMGIWSPLAGISDQGLRSLSLILGCATPLAAMLIPVRGLTATERLVWAAILALWPPAVAYAQSATPLALVYLLATLQAAAFVDFLGDEQKSLRTTLVWAAASALLISASVAAGFVVCVQGLMLVLVKRGDPRRVWPAALGILALVRLFTIHGRNSTIRPLVGPAFVPGFDSHLSLAFFKPTLGHLVAGPLGWWLIFLIAPVLLSLRRGPAWGKGENDLPQSFPGAVETTALASGLALVGYLTAALSRGAFSSGLCAPFMPGLMLGALGFFRLSALGRQKAASIFLAVMLVVGMVALWTDLTRSDQDGDRYSFERASAAVEAAGIHKVVFAIDDARARDLSPQQVKDLGGFFFRRSHYPIEIIPGRFDPSLDPHAGLTRDAQPVGAAILLLYVEGTEYLRAKAFSDGPDAFDQSYQCLDYGRGEFHVLRCLPK